VIILPHSVDQPRSCMEDRLQYLVSSHAVNSCSGKCNTLSCNGPWRVYNTSRG